MDILYMIRSGIYLGRLLSIFGVRPTNCLDAISQKPDTGREKWSKRAIFRGFR